MNGDGKSALETKEMARLVSEQKRNSIISGEIAVTSKETAKLDKTTVGIIITLIVGLALFFISQIVNLELKYKKLIRGIDRHKPSNWPVSGLTTALYVEYPGLAGISFPNKNLPTAAFLSFMAPPYATNSCWLNNTSQILFAMMERGLIEENLSAQDLICLSWGNSAAGQTCANDCQSSSPWPGMVSGGIGMGSLGAFAGGMTEIGAVTLAGGVAGIVAGGLISYFNHKQQISAN